MSNVIDDVADFFHDAGRFISRATLPPASIRNTFVGQVLNFPRQSLRYIGAAAFAPILPASLEKQAFGLTPKESANFEIGAKVARGVGAAAVTVVGGAAVLGRAPGLFGQAAPVFSGPGYPVANQGLNLGYGATNYAAPVATPGFATPASFSGSIGAQTSVPGALDLAYGAPYAPGSTPVGYASASNFYNVSSPAEDFAAANSGIVGTSGASANGFLAGLGKAATGLGTLAKGVLGGVGSLLNSGAQALGIYRGIAGGGGGSGQSGGGSGSGAGGVYVGGSSGDPGYAGGPGGPGGVTIGLPGSDNSGILSGLLNSLGLGGGPNGGAAGAQQAGVLGGKTGTILMVGTLLGVAYWLYKGKK